MQLGNKSQDGINSVIAETEKDNYASQRVLLKCNMVKYHESDTGFWWRLENTAEIDLKNITIKHKLAGNNDFTSNNEMFIVAEK